MTIFDYKNIVITSLIIVSVYLNPISVSMKQLIPLLLIISIIQGQAFGQAITPRVINTTGGTYKDNSYIIEWSIGELALVNLMQASGADGKYVFSNGFLQPFAHYPKQLNKSFSNDEIRILPNPVRDNLEIHFQTAEQGQIRFILYDLAGHALYSKEFFSTGSKHIEKIIMTDFSNSSYMLQVTLHAANDPVQTTTGSYKIIKLK